MASTEPMGLYRIFMSVLDPPIEVSTLPSGKKIKRVVEKEEFVFGQTPDCFTNVISHVHLVQSVAPKAQVTVGSVAPGTPIERFNYFDHLNGRRFPRSNVCFLDVQLPCRTGAEVSIYFDRIIERILGYKPKLKGSAVTRLVFCNYSDKLEVVESTDRMFYFLTRPTTSFEEVQNEIINRLYVPGLCSFSEKATEAFRRDANRHHEKIQKRFNRIWQEVARKAEELTRNPMLMKLSENAVEGVGNAVGAERMFVLGTIKLSNGYLLVGCGVPGKRLVSPPTSYSSLQIIPGLAFIPQKSLVFTSARLIEMFGKYATFSKRLKSFFGAVVNAQNHQVPSNRGNPLLSRDPIQQFLINNNARRLGDFGDNL